MKNTVDIRVCPHCRVGLNFKIAGGEENSLATDPDGSWWLGKAICPTCDRMILWLGNECIAKGYFCGVDPPPRTTEVRMIHPKSGTRYCSPGVPVEIAEDFKEACLVLNDSPKASAALSRRCLQNILQQVARVQKARLIDQIDQVIDSKTLPHNITMELHAIRNIGNFAAHPEKNMATGEIVPVESDEAEWCLSIIEQLLHYYFVTLPASESRVSALNRKLEETGKPSMKSGLFHQSKTAPDDEADCND